MKRTIYGIGLLLCLVACKTDNTDDHKTWDDPVNDAEQNSSPETVSKEDVVEIETLFDEKDFKSNIEMELLAELNICDTLPVEGSYTSPCSPENFKFFKLKEDKGINEAFALQIKALTVLRGERKPLPMRHLMIFERENGMLVKLNGFRGNLVEKIARKNSNDDLIIRFYIPDDQVFMNCLFVWDREELKYNYKSVEVIEGEDWGGPVINAVKDSVSQVVYTDLMNHRMIF